MFVASLHGQWPLVKFVSLLSRVLKRSEIATMSDVVAL
jgi:hypothetical protein